MSKKNEVIYQVLTRDQYHNPTLQNWFKSLKEAEAEIKDCERFWEDSEFWIEEGKEYIFTTCRSCSDVDTQERSDAYGIFTGHYCEPCYNSSKYPYRKERYDYAGNGERLEDNY